MEKLSVGDTLLLVDLIPSRSDTHKRECRVSSVGRLYFYVECTGNYFEIAFRLSDWAEKPSWMLTKYLVFRSGEEYKKFLEEVRLFNLIREEAFRYHRTPSQGSTGFSLSQLKEVISILNLDLGEKDELDD